LEDLIVHIIKEYGFLLYPFISAWTFVEGETVVLVTGILAAEGKFAINVELLALAAWTGSFLGDQLYYYIGRRYGAPLLKRWPSLSERIDWAFEAVNRAPATFILSFRWIYGVRNAAPFIVGIAGVPRVKYFILNLIAAGVWAHSFAWGGYYMGRKLEDWMGDSKWFVLGGFILCLITFAVWSALRGRNKPADDTPKE
jgi:membrane protein DedA with SNARE-associated domain